MFFMVFGAAGSTCILLACSSFLIGMSVTVGKYTGSILKSFRIFPLMFGPFKGLLVVVDHIHFFLGF